jgi:hypothetical protein
MILHVTIMGVVATLVLDAWAAFLNRAFGLPTTNWGMVGRWVANLPRGKFIHSPISDTPEVRHEHLLGWVFHYGIGIAYALIYMLIVEVWMGSGPSLLSAALFGLCTLVAPWFLLQPGLGMGVFASLAPNPTVIRVMNLVAHTIFGLALYLGWIISTDLVPR